MRRMDALRVCAGAAVAAYWSLSEASWITLPQVR